MIFTFNNLLIFSEIYIYNKYKRYKNIKEAYETYSADWKFRIETGTTPQNPKFQKIFAIHSGNDDNVYNCNYSLDSIIIKILLD